VKTQLIFPSKHPEEFCGIMTIFNAGTIAAHGNSSKIE
jgi:hypothetical protein